MTKMSQTTKNLMTKWSQTTKNSLSKKIPTTKNFRYFFNFFDLEKTYYNKKFNE